MPSDFNAFGATRFNSFRDSGFNARGTCLPFTLRFWFSFEHATGKFISFVSGANWATFVNGSGAVAFQLGGIFVDPSPQLYVSGAWSYFLCGYDGSQIFCQLNDGPRHFQTASGKLGPDLFLEANSRKVGGFITYDHPRLDEVAIWKGRVLTEEEATADRESVAGFSTVSLPGLLAYWELEGTNGTHPATLVDSLNGHTLTRVDQYQQEMLDLFPGIAEALSPTYGPGKIVNGLLGTNTGGFEALGYVMHTFFQGGGDDFIFGDD